MNGCSTMKGGLRETKAGATESEVETIILQDFFFFIRMKSTRSKLLKSFDALEFIFLGNPSGDPFSPPYSVFCHGCHLNGRQVFWGRRDVCRGLTFKGLWLSSGFTVSERLWRLVEDESTDKLVLAEAQLVSNKAEASRSYVVRER